MEKRQCWAEQGSAVPGGEFIRSHRYEFEFFFDKEIGHQMAKVWIDENNFHVFYWEDFYARFFF